MKHLRLAEASIIIITTIGAILFYILEHREVFGYSAITLLLFYLFLPIPMTKTEKASIAYIIVGILVGLLMFINISLVMFGVLFWPGRLGMIDTAPVLMIILFFTIYKICSSRKEQKNFQNLWQFAKTRMIGSAIAIGLSFWDQVVYGM